MARRFRAKNLCFFRDGWTFERSASYHPSMTNPVRALVLSHTVVFAAGFAAGKTWNADELNLYRDAHENWWSRIKRKGTTIVLATASVGVVVILARAARRS